jgi:hypothetical protein
LKQVEKVKDQISFAKLVNITSQVDLTHSDSVRDFLLDQINIHHKLQSLPLSPDYLLSHGLPLLSQLKSWVSSECIKNYLDANYEQLTAKLNKKDNEKALKAIQAVREMNAWDAAHQYSYELFDEGILERLFLNREALTLAQQLELGELFI